MLKMNLKKALALLASVLILCTLIPLSAFLAHADSSNLVVNGDFETGDLTGWENLYDGCTVEIVGGRNGGSALKMSCGQWQMVRQSIAVEENTDYTITAYGKGATNMTLLVKDGNDSNNIVQDSFKAGSDWSEITVNFNSGTNTKIYLSLMGNNPGASVTVDDVVMTKVGGGEEPDSAYVLDMDFEDGVAGFEGATVVTDGSNCLKWTANGGWSSTQIVVSNVKKDTDYVVTFKAKGSVAGDMGTTLQDANWGPYWNGPAFNVTTAWKKYKIEFNTANYPTADGKMFFKFQDVGVAMDLYVDDLKMIEKSAFGDEPDEPEQIEVAINNADFETGNNTGWEIHQSTAIEAEAAHDGAYGAHLKGAGDWGGMLDQAVAVNKGKSYEISFWVKVNATGINFQIKDGGASGALLDSDWIDGNVAANREWIQKEFTVTPTTDVLFLNFCGSGTGAAEDAYVDSFTITQLKTASFDGYITNGDFEIGEITPWDNLYGGNTVSMVAGRDSAQAIKVEAGAWTHVRQAVAVEANTDYVLTVWGKDVNNTALLIKDIADTTNIAQTTLLGGAEWQKTTLEFNSGANTSIYVSFMGNEVGAGYTVDDITMTVKGDEPDQPDVPAYPTELINGDFEDGSNGWTLSPAASIDTDTHGGSGALKLDNPALWAEAALQAVSVQKNTNYEIAWYSKRVSGTGTFNMILMKEDDTNYDIVSGKNWMNDPSTDWVKNKIVIATGDNDVIKFKLTNQDPDPGVILIDDITMIVEGSEPVDPTASLIKNGSFEDGKEEWTFGGDTALYSDDYYEGSKSVKLSQSAKWSEALTQEVKVEPNAKYVIKFYTKRASGAGVWNLNLMDADTIYTTAENLEIIEGQSYFDHKEQGKWTEHRIVFQAIGTKNKEKEVTKVLVKFSPEADSAGEYLMDYIGMWTEGNEPAPDDPDNPIIPPKSPAYMTSFGVLNNRPIDQKSNLLKNPSFEKSGGQWKEGFTGETISVVKDKTTLFGDKSLFFNTAGIEEETKLVFWMDVEPETDYVFSTWLKGAFLSDDNRALATIGVVNEEGKFLSMSSAEDKLTLFLNGERQIVPTAWDNEWHIRAIQFNSGETTKIGIALAGTNSQMWIDDMALFEVGDGTKYMSDNAGGLVHLSYDIDSVTCLDKDSLIPDPNFNTKDKAGFWADSYGWRNGFLTFEENEYEYGTSLKYTESEETTALSIIKTIKVKPHTDYTFSVDLKILQDGWGKLVLIDGKKREPINFLEIAFDSYDYDESQSYYGWYTTASKFNTDVYDEISIAVVNEGGIALMDNMRLYESDKGANVTDKFIPPPQEPEDDYSDGWYDDWEEEEIIEEEIIEDVIIDEPETPTDPIVEPKPVDNGFDYLWVIIGGSALALAGGAVLVILLIVKKKKKAATEAAAAEAATEENA